MQREVTGIATHRPRNGIVRRVPDSDILDPCKTITAGQMAARMGVQESQVLKAIKELNIQRLAYHPDTHGGSFYALRDFGVVRAHLRGKR